MPIPLNVFEPRYLQLVRECTESGEPFGIALIREGPEVGGPADPHAVGTTARIEQAAPGALRAVQLLARGERRVRLLALHRDRPYLWADAEELGDAPGGAPPERIAHGQRLLEEFERLRYSAQGGYARGRGAPSPAPPGVVADAIGATGAGSPAERQELLETLGPRRAAGARAGDLRAGGGADAPPRRRRRAPALGQPRRAQLKPRASPLPRARDGRASGAQTPRRCGGGGR